MVEWRDVSSYRQGERGKVEPRCWETDVGAFRVVVHRNIHYPPDVWLVSIHGLWSGPRELTTRHVKGAQIEALEMLAAACKDALSAMREEVGG